MVQSLSLLTTLGQETRWADSPELTWGSDSERVKLVHCWETGCRPMWTDSLLWCHYM